MKIYTYHRTIEAGFDDPVLMSIWRESWTRRGFDPQTLGPADAAAHPRFRELEHANGLFTSDIGLRQYVSACYERWFAFAVAARRDGGPTLTGDWDVVNYGFTPSELLSEGLGGRIKHLSGSATPCLVYGTPEQYDAVIDLFFEYARNPHRNTASLQEAVHDQNILDAYPDRWISVPFVVEYPQPGWDSRSLVHYPHGRLYFPGGRGEKIRQLRPLM